MKLLILGFIILAIVFLTYPEIDLMVAGLFYQEGVGFYPKNEGILGYIYDGVIFFTTSLTIAYVVLLLIHFALKKQFSNFDKRILVFLLLALALGPGLLVNSVFKEHWGRARPAQVEQFGGEKKFSPPLLINNQCETNCSFVSGHASIGFYLFAFAFVFPAYKRFIAASAIASGVGIGFVRIAQGGHFLSDVLFSGLFVFLTIYILYYLILRPRDLKTPNA